MGGLNAPHIYIQIFKLYAFDWLLFNLINGKYTRTHSHECEFATDISQTNQITKVLFAIEMCGVFSRWAKVNARERKGGITILDNMIITFDKIFKIWTILLSDSSH